MNLIKAYIFLFIISLITSGCHSHKKNNASSKAKSKSETVKSKPKSNYSKIAGIIGVNESSLKQHKLYDFVNAWYGTPYKYGGCDRRGTDCSCLTINLYKDVFNKSLPRTADEMMKSCDKLSESKANEGDLVFFKIESKTVTHVGVLLQNDKFIHASTKKGVMISSMDEPYFQKYFFCYGRLK